MIRPATNTLICLRRWVPGGDSPERWARRAPAVPPCGGPGYIDRHGRDSRTPSPLVEGTQVTDTGLEHLKGFTQLHLLSLEGTQVTDAGVQRLKQALPNCDIRCGYERYIRGQR